MSIFKSSKIKVLSLILRKRVESQSYSQMHKERGVTMRTLYYVALVAGLLCCFTGAQAQAISIDVTPSFQVSRLGSTVEIELVISGLGRASPPSVSTFDLDLTYDPDILKFQTHFFHRFWKVQVLFK